MNEANCATVQPHSTLLMDSITTIILNLALFPGLAWLFYRGKAFLEGEVVATEVFFGGVVCTLVVGTTGHFIATKGRTCKACIHRGNCPFLAIFIVGIVMGVLCVTASHLYLGNGPVAFATLIQVKIAQGLFLGIAIPLCMEKMKLII